MARSAFTLTIAVAVLACSSEGTAEETTTSAPAPTTTTTAAPTTTTTAPSTTTTLPATTTTTIPTTTTTLSPFPPAAETLEHGGEIWAVYLAVADDFSDPGLDDAVALAEMYGYLAGAGDMGCDQGASDAIGIPEGGGEAVVGVYFNSEADASLMVAALAERGHEVAGMGRVQTFCLD